MGLHLSSVVVGQNAFNSRGSRRQTIEKRPVAQLQALPPQVVHAETQPVLKKDHMQRRFHFLATAAPSLKDTPKRPEPPDATSRAAAQPTRSKSRLVIMEDATGKIWNTHFQLWNDASKILLHMTEDVKKASSPLEAAGIFMKSGVDLHVTALDGSVHQFRNTLDFIGELLKKMGGS